MVSARATAVAPYFFKAFNHPASKQTYYDGGVYHNNPINVAERERKLIWPSVKEPDVIISIGTGRILDISKVTEPARVKAVASKGLISHGIFLANVAKDHIAASMDCEQTWRDFRSAKGVTSAERYRYIRLNTALKNSPPRLDDVSKMGDLRREAREQFEESYEIKKLARRLVATSFYFQPDNDSLSKAEITGT